MQQARGWVGGSNPTCNSFMHAVRATDPEKSESTTTDANDDPHELREVARKGKGFWTGSRSALGSLHNKRYVGSGPLLPRPLGKLFVEKL